MSKERWIVNKDIDRAIELLETLKDVNNNKVSKEGDYRSGIDTPQYKEWNELRSIVARLEDCFKPSKSDEDLINNAVESARKQMMKDAGLKE